MGVGRDMASWQPAPIRPQHGDQIDFHHRAVGEQTLHGHFAGDRPGVIEMARHRRDAGLPIGRRTLSDKVPAKLDCIIESCAELAEHLREVLHDDVALPDDVPGLDWGARRVARHLSAHKDHLATTNGMRERLGQGADVAPGGEGSWQLGSILAKHRVSVDLDGEAREGEMRQRHCRDRWPGTGTERRSHGRQELPLVDAAVVGIIGNESSHGFEADTKFAHDRANV